MSFGGWVRDGLSGIRSDMVEEALRVTGKAEEHSVPPRLLGGLTVMARAKDGLEPAFEREYAGLD